MKISRISLQHYRNIELARLEFDPDRPIFFIGSNGQGKSNLLEALGLLTAVRSFRTHELSPLVQQQHKQARVLYEIGQPNGDKTSVELQLAARKRTVLVDEVPVLRMADFVGQFPSVVFAADDTQLIKLSPQARRRFFDLLFSVVDADYLEGLQAYHRALKERNNALKGKMDRAVISAYGKLLAKWGLFLIGRRREWIAQFSPLFEHNYTQISENEVGNIQLRISLDVDSEDAYLEKLEKTFERDSLLGSTNSGPHRDDYIFEVHELGAKTYASDGQQRSVVLALKLAQIELIEMILKRKPIVLLDDILGELDHERKARFWDVFDHGCQVFASGTSLPSYSLGLQWQTFDVNAGQFELRTSH